MNNDRSNPTLVPIVTLDNEVEAALFDSLLSEEGIEHVTQPFGDGVYEPAFRLQRGWGRVLAPEPLRERILNLLAQWRAAPSEPDSPDPVAPEDKTAPRSGDAS